MPGKDVEKGKLGVYAAARPCPQQILPAYLERGQRPSKKGSNSGDSSGPLFSMYSKTAETEDNTMAERWNKDADGMLIFVSLHIRLNAITCTNRKSIDRFILCGRRFIPHSVNPGPEI